MEKFETTLPVAEYFRKYVDIEKFADCCRQCPNYGKNWSCGPYDFDPADIWKQYSAIRVVAYKIHPEPGMSTAEARKLLAGAKQEMMDYCMALENAQPGSMSLFAGTCSLCAQCTRQDKLPCRNPSKMRYSIEAIGGDVGKTIKDLFNIDIVWERAGCLPEYYILCGGLLY